MRTKGCGGEVRAKAASNGRTEQSNPASALLREQAASRMPLRGRIAQEAKAPGKAWGYADVGTFRQMVGAPAKNMLTTDAAMQPESWADAPWKDYQVAVTRLQQRIHRASRDEDHKTVHRLQRLLLHSRGARFLAVRKVTQDNRGKQTAGVDGIASLSPSERFRLANSLSLRTKAKPIRRVFIPKPGKDELRPLGIPTIEDRALQALVKMALEPEWEAKFEPNSYGFRPGRSAHDAIAAIFTGIRYKAKYVLEADIEKCFDRIDHEQLLAKMHAIKPIHDLVKGWLKAGILDRGETLFPTQGTPQGGVISPLLANIALHGLEASVREEATRLWGTQAMYGSQIPQVIRYADDFVIMHHDLDTLKKLRTTAEVFLLSMGLQLSQRKTRISHTLVEHEGNVGFDFLGFTVRQFPVTKHQSGRNRYGTRLGFKTIITPSKKAVSRHIAEVNRIIDDHKAAPRAALIQHLIPVVRGWCNYYSTVASSSAFHAADRALHEALLAWIKRRHKRGLRRAVNANLDDRWRLTEGNLVLKWHSETPIRRHVKVRGTKSPYDGDSTYWATRLGRSPVLNSRVAALLKRQRGKCSHCDLVFTSEDILEVHHRDGNHANDKFANLALLHGHCHDTAHRRGTYDKS